MIYPFPKRDFEEFLASVEQVLVVELSYAAQFYKYLRTFPTCPAGDTHVLQAVRRQEPDDRRGRRPRSDRVVAPGRREEGWPYERRARPPAFAERLQDGPEARLVRRLRRLRRPHGALPRDGRAAARAVEHRRHLRHRLLVAPARLRRRPTGSTASTAARCRSRPGSSGRAAGREGHRGRRRRRRHRDRRQSLHARRAAQPRHRVLHDGQRDLRPDEGPGRADDADGRQDEVDALREPRAVGRPVRARDLLRRDLGRPRILRRPQGHSWSSSSRRIEHQRLRVPERHVALRHLARRRPVQDPQGEGRRSFRRTTT